MQPYTDTDTYSSIRLSTYVIISLTRDDYPYGNICAYFRRNETSLALCNETLPARVSWVFIMCMRYDDVSH